MRRSFQCPPARTAGVCGFLKARCRTRTDNRLAILVAWNVWGSRHSERSALGRRDRSWCVPSSDEAGLQNSAPQYLLFKRRSLRVLSSQSGEAFQECESPLVAGGQLFVGDPDLCDDSAAGFEHGG
jgi:hypothetical protein